MSTAMKKSPTFWLREIKKQWQLGLFYKLTCVFISVTRDVRNSNLAEMSSPWGINCKQKLAIMLTLKTKHIICVRLLFSFASIHIMHLEGEQTKKVCTNMYAST